MTRDVNDVMHRKRAGRILGDLKKSVSWVLLAEALWRMPHTLGGGGQMEKPA